MTEQTRLRDHHNRGEHGQPGGPSPGMAGSLAIAPSIAVPPALPATRIFFGAMYSYALDRGSRLDAVRFTTDSGFRLPGMV